MLRDRYDLVLTTASAAAREAYVEATDRALTFYPGALAGYDRALAADPGFALAHAGKAQVLLRHGRRSRRPRRRPRRRMCRSARPATSVSSISCSPARPRRRSPPCMAIS